MVATRAAVNVTSGKLGETMKVEQMWRYTFLGTLLTFVPLLIVLRLLQLQIDPSMATWLDQRALEHAYIDIPINTARGLIYDRWGHVLAANEIVYEVGIELQDVLDPHTIARTCNEILGEDYSVVLGMANIKASPTSRYVTVKRNVTVEQMERLKAEIERVEAEAQTGNQKNPPRLRGLLFTPQLRRTYPEKMVGSNFIGYVNMDGRGVFGVEEEYDELLAGKERKIRRPLSPNETNAMPTVPDGASLVLTIDREIQAAMEEVLDQGIAHHGAASGTIVVMDPRNGEVLAMATTPRMDPNEFWRLKEVFPGETPYNRAVSQEYEPGSVYKVLTMASALDKGVVKPETTFIDTGVFEIGGTYIYNWNGGAWGQVTMKECMKYSLNVCLAWVATQLGAKDFYHYMNEFGIGHLTGIELAWEKSGYLKSPGDENWYDADLGTNSFGQGVSATPLQMAVAVSAVANGGKMMAPHVVRSIVNKGYQHNTEQRVAGMPIGPQAAKELSEMLADNVETESYEEAVVTGYRLAGKTGTGEIPTPFGYTSNQTNASFVGWGPVDDPRFLVYVWLEKPTSSPWGSEVAAPVFRQAVEKLVVLMDIPPDAVRQQLQGQ